jgi:hypothetical protein
MSVNGSNDVLMIAETTYDAFTLFGNFAGALKPCASTRINARIRASGINAECISLTCDCGRRHASALVDDARKKDARR